MVVYRQNLANMLHNSMIMQSLLTLYNFRGVIEVLLISGG